jgi:hypothetical protein
LSDEAHAVHHRQHARGRLVCRGRLRCFLDISKPGLESDHMISFSDWFPLATVGLTFTLLGGIKLLGLKRGIVGGADKPAIQRLCGT